MEELAGHVAEFSVDAQGSRYVQHRMEAAQQEEKQLLIDEILPDVAHLANDGYGNYVVQNFLEHGSERQRAALAEALLGSVHILSKQAHGCRVIQRALELVEPVSRAALVDELLDLKRGGRHRAAVGPPERVGAAVGDMVVGNTAVLFQHFARHSSATHVLQKAIVVLQRAAKPPKATFANGGRKTFSGAAAGLQQPAKATGAGSAGALEREDARMQLFAAEACFASLGEEKMLELSCHPHAYRVVQKLLGDCDASRSEAMAMMVRVTERAFDRLAFDQHGNFLLQHMLDSGSAEQASQVQSFVASEAHALCTHKFASHLVEKCLTTPSATVQHKTVLVRALLKTSAGDHEVSAPLPSDAQNDPLLRLMQDPYANFVVQRAFDETRGSKVHGELCAEIRARSSELSHFTFGRHILQHMTNSTMSPPRRAGGRNHTRSPVNGPH